MQTFQFLTKRAAAIYEYLRLMLRVGRLNLVALIKRREQPEPVEFIVGVWEIFYGFYFILPWDVFAVSPFVYGWMRSLMAQTVWGIGIFTIGACQVCCLAWPHPKYRQRAAWASQLLWGGLLTGWLVTSCEITWRTLLTRHILVPGLFASAFGLFCLGWLLLATWVNYCLEPEKEVTVERVTITETHSRTFIDTTP